jgi:hypothetical protein
MRPLGDWLLAYGPILGMILVSIVVIYVWHKSRQDNRRGL